VDLIRDLTNGLPVPCPFRNSPPPYEKVDPDPNGNWQTSFHALRDKNPLLWQSELVDQTLRSGLPLLLECVGLLLVATMAAMETRHVLHDRNLHGPNTFGKGNQLLPPKSPSHSGIQDLQSRLGPNAGSSWVRQDIWGLLAASYSLLLRSAPSLLGSPRAGVDSAIRQAARSLEVPADLRSFSFCRLTLLPALQHLPSSSPEVNLSEFCLAVLVETYSHYLDVIADGSLPISRNHFEKEQDEELKLRRSQQATQRDYYAMSGQTPPDEFIPSSVDLMSIPDCIDDIVALATSLCALGVNYARHFWTQTEEGELKPCRALAALGRFKEKDSSLLPCYVSWLASLAVDEATALVVHDILSEPEEGTSPKTLTWTTLIFNLRWYAQQLSPYDTDVVSKASSTTSTTTSASKNTDYYYNLEGNFVPESSKTSSSLWLRFG